MAVGTMQPSFCGRNSRGIQARARGEPALGQRGNRMDRGPRIRGLAIIGLLVSLLGAVQAAAGEVSAHAVTSLRLAIEDLVATHGESYAGGQGYLRRLAALEPALHAGDPEVTPLFEALKREALLANPALNLDRLLIVRRKHIKPPEEKWHKGTWSWPTGAAGKELGLPSNHECYESTPKSGWDNEIASLSLKRPEEGMATVFRPADGGWVGEIKLHWDGRKLLFTRADAESWKIWEVDAGGRGLRQVSQMPSDVDCMDPCYLPDGRIIFGSTAPVQAVPCWHGLRRVTNLYRMNGDGSGVRQLCFDQDHDLHPHVLPGGQVLYNRWEYTAQAHMYQRTLMVMNPDGTGQRSIYGSNSYYPNAMYFAKPLPGDDNRFVQIVSGYHGPHRMGQLVVLDTTRGFFEADGLVCRISGRGEPVRREVRDNLLGDDWPKFLHPWPLTRNQFLVACWPSAKSNWGIYLADVFDNLLLLREESGFALLEPVPLAATPVPPVIPDQVAAGARDAQVYVHDLYRGRGLQGVPAGTVKSLRVISYDFGYPGLAGPDKIGFHGPWEVVRILGTVPVEPDGSAFFRVPANTPVAVQALDADGCAVQLMRNWFSAMPGETRSCVGCHESPGETGLPRPAAAAIRSPRELTPWNGRARGFDFAREVQPVLDRSCVRCHDGSPTAAAPDLRPEEQRPDYAGSMVSPMSVKRLHPAMKAATGGRLKYTPAYEALRAYVRVPAVEDDVSVLVPGEYHAATSPLIQLLRKGHHGLRLDGEGMERLVTWIDLNAPCHGTWGEVFPIPDGVHERRLELRRLCGGPAEDPEADALLKPAALESAATGLDADPEPVIPAIRGWPFDAGEAKRRQTAGAASEMILDLGGGVTLKLVWIPPGEFVMGDPRGAGAERAMSPVRIPAGFWMAAAETTNEQFRCFDPEHDSRYYAKRHARNDDEGLSLNDPRQPAVRVAWSRAVDFCEWLRTRTGVKVRLPSEAQWEYACRAGSATAFSFGEADVDFSLHANLGDLSFAGKSPSAGIFQMTGGLDHLIVEGASLADSRFDDGAIVTAPAASYRSNAWGLHDMHGNAAEWTASADGPNKVVRGGSFFDAPKHGRSGSRQTYPPWQRVFNVGFRIIAEPATLTSK